MAKIQLISCVVNLGGDRNNTVVRDAFEPVTFPEVLILQAIHGGEEHVHSLVDVGSVERDPSEEMARLAAKYGGVVNDAFPSVAGRPSLPAGDDTIPSKEAVDEAEAARAAALENAKKPKRKRGRKPVEQPVEKPAPGDTDGGIPPLNDLPS